MPEKIENLSQKAFHIKYDILKTCLNSGSGHLASSLSCADLLTCLYFGGTLKYRPDEPKWSERDLVFISKGHASLAIYVVLSEAGFFPQAELEKFATADSMLGIHVERDVPGVELSSGALGHAFGVAAGAALGAKMNRTAQHVYALTGDGECYEGSIWETAMFAGHHKLSNLTVLLDRNRRCVTDYTENIVKLEPMAERWQAFGWNTIRIDGHSVEDINKALTENRGHNSDAPTVIIADTVKGHGIDMLIESPLCHGLHPAGAKGDVAVSQLKELCNRCKKCLRKDIWL
jgi:transketolase